MSQVNMSEIESKIISEYSRIKGISVDILLRRDIDSIIRDALVEQIKIDYSTGNISQELTELFRVRDYVHLVLTLDVENIPSSILKNLESRDAE